MTPVEAQAFVLYALRSLTEDQYVGAQLALVHSDAKAADLVRDAAIELCDDALPLELIERIGSVHFRVAASLRKEEVERARRRPKVVALHPDRTSHPRRD